MSSEVTQRRRLLVRSDGLARWQARLGDCTTPHYPENQLRLLRRDNVWGRGANLPTRISPQGDRAIVPTYLRRYRPEASAARIAV